MCKREVNMATLTSNSKKDMGDCDRHKHNTRHPDNIRKQGELVPKKSQLLPASFTVNLLVS